VAIVGDVTVKCRAPEVSFGAAADHQLITRPLRPSGSFIHVRRAIRSPGAAAGFMQRGSVQQFLAGDVQVHVCTCSLDPINIHHAYETSCASGRKHQPVQAEIRRWRSSDHAQNALSKLTDATFVQSGFGAGLVASNRSSLKGLSK
jgi:hypothetical protein